MKRLGLVMCAMLTSRAATEPATQVTVRTDAPLGLFDAVTVEVRRGGENETCSACRRDFEARELPATFAIAHGDSAPTVHVRLSRARGEASRVASSVEVYARLERGDDDTAEVRVGWRQAGVVHGSWEAPVAATSLAPLAAPEVASCPADVASKEACVPGGVFWFGDPTLDLGGGVDREGNDERLIALSTFVLDRHELTLGELRALAITPSAPCQSGADDVAGGCVTWTQADEACRRLGKRLPTEAELEYVMGGLRSTKFPWGDAVAECGDAIYEGCGFTEAQPPGRSTRDRLRVGDAEIVDLAGNLAEWSADVWSSTRDACFAAPVLVDPRCTTPGPTRPGQRVFKGAGFTLDPFYLGAAMRGGVAEANAVNEVLGFRCARGGKT